MGNCDPYSDSPEPFWLVWRHQVYSGVGAGIVMESITLTTPPPAPYTKSFIFRFVGPI